MAGTWQYLLINSETGEPGRGGDASQVAGPLFIDEEKELPSGSDVTEIALNVAKVTADKPIDLFWNGQKIPQRDFTRDVPNNKILVTSPRPRNSTVIIEIRTWS